MRRRLVLVAGALAVLTCFVLWDVIRSRGYDPKRRHPEMPDYAAKLLVAHLRAADLLEDARDDVGVAKAQRESREFYEDMAATMPRGREDEALLSEAVSYFDGDAFDVWSNCRSADKEVYRGGTTAADILRDLVQTMRDGGRRRLEKRLIRRFVVMYGVLTIDRHMTHAEAIADLTHRVRNFGDF